MSYLIGILSLVLGLVIGLHLPDLDLETSRLVHRSIITHGCLVPVLLFFLARKSKATMPRLFAIGFNLSAALHLSFDLFPKSWTGFALIHVPLYGRATPLFSQLWIAASVVVCVYLALALTRNVFELVVISGSLVVSFGLYAETETNIAGRALLALAVATVVALALPSDFVGLIKKLRKKTAA